MFSSTIRKGEIPVCCYKLSHSAASLCYHEGKLLSRVDSTARFYVLEERKTLGKKRICNKECLLDLTKSVRALCSRKLLSQFSQLVGAPSSLL